MKEHEQAAFLWQWTERRRIGKRGALLFGLGIGALGGLLFAVLMLYAMTANGGTFEVSDDVAPFFRWLADLLGPTGFLFVVAIPPFALLGAFLANRVWGMLDSRYVALIDAGVRIPDTKPRWSLKDRAPALAVLGGFILLALWLLGMLFWEIERSGL
jgi:hypothetical protein